MGSPVVLAFDVGTSGVKALVVDGAGRILGSSVRTYGLVTPQPGWVEQDLDAIVAALGAASREVLDAVAISPRDVAAVGLTAQMFSVVAVDRDGVAVRPMLSWLDQRASAEAAALGERVGDPYAVFGSILTAKDIVPRIAWLAAHEPATTRRAAWYLDCKEAVGARLTGAIGIDPAGASAFRLVNPATGEWDPERCRQAGIERDRLPPIGPASAVLGGLTEAAAELTGLRAGTPVVIGAGDVPASQIGAGATGVGAIHLSLGTAVYFGITLDRPLPDPERRLGPLGHVVAGQWLLWLEIATGGAALAWLDRQLAGLSPNGQVRDHAAVERAVAAAANGMDQLLFGPWLTGERVPFFDDGVRAAFTGLALHHGPGHLTRAVMEGVACQIALALEYGLAYGVPAGRIRTVGGGGIGAAWTGIIADTLGRPLELVARPQDAAAAGAAACALVGAGLADDVRSAVPPRVERIVEPDPARAEGAAARLERFRHLYPALRSLAGPERAATLPAGPAMASAT